MGNFLSTANVALVTGIIPAAILALTLGVMLFAKYCFFGKANLCTSKRNLQGKTAIVTGANSGIGKETARDLACRGARVILACRSRERTLPVVKEIQAACGHLNVRFEELDLSSSLSICSFVGRVLKTEDSVDILVNNAGLNLKKGETNAARVDMTFAVNHLGPFILTHLLLDKIKASAPARIVNVSSMMHQYGVPGKKGLRFDKENGHYKYLKAYDTSKLANILHANALAERLKDSGVTANSLHPGAVYTGIWRFLDMVLPAPVARLAHAAFRFVMWSPWEGAQTSIFCAVDESLEGVTGKYFYNCREATPSAFATDRQMQETLWDVSMELTGLKEMEHIGLKETDQHKQQ